MMWMTFFGSERFHESLPDEAHTTDETHGTDDSHTSHSSDDDDEEHHALPPNFHPHESPWTMTVPLIVLAVLSTVGGLVGVPYALSGGAIPNVFEHTLEPVIAHVGNKGTGHEAPAAKPHASVSDSSLANLYASAEAPRLGTETAAGHEEHSPEALRNERLLAGLSILLALSGIAIGYALFGKTPLRKMPKILEEKWRIDELYNGYIVDPLTTLSREGLWKGFDLGFIDGIVNGIGYAITEVGKGLRQVQVGFVRSYAAIILLGALAVLGYFIYYGLKLVG
jgi:NADH-quinone oxidoreductase subunit L